MEGLIRLDLSHNQLSGTLPDLSNLGELASFSIRRNNISGQFPNIISSQLASFDIGYNLFQGQIPSDFQFANPNGFFGVAHNNFSGNIPPQLQAAQIDLSDNLFNGSFPVNLLIPTGSYLILSGNRLSGPLPEIDITNMLSVEFLSLENNDFIGNIPKSFSYLRLVSLKLDNNHKMSGQIPVEILRNIFMTLSFVGTNLTCPDNPTWRTWNKINNQLCNFPPILSSNSQPFYTSSSSSSNNNINKSLYIILGVTIGALLLILIMILIAVLVKRRRMRMREYKPINDDDMD